jgi:hypothetical protein
MRRLSFWHYRRKVRRLFMLADPVTMTLLRFAYPKHVELQRP